MLKGGRGREGVKERRSTMTVSQEELPSQLSHRGSLGIVGLLVRA